VKFRSQQTGSADFIRSVADVRLAAVKLQHAWQGLTPLGGGHVVLPMFGPHSALEGFLRVAETTPNNVKLRV
jgi:hypothetical protein